jgi:hypothetical protein
VNTRIINFVAGVSVVLAGSSVRAEEGSIAIYKRMQQLEGDWVLSPAEDQEGKATTHKAVAPIVGSDQVAMSFRLIGAGSTVQESLLPGTSREMVTMYHCQDTGCSQVRATHYCIKQNQPQMVAVQKMEDGALIFSCDMSTELCQSSEDHVHKIAHKISADGKHLKTTYSSFKNGEHSKDSVYHFDKMSALRR